MKGENLEIKRFLREKKAVTKTLCKPGRITVLIDESGDGALLPYTNTLAGKKTEDRFQFYLNAEPLDTQNIELVGFGDKLPDTMSLQDFLADSGYDEDEIKSLIEEYDLHTSAYLKCSQVTTTITRQLLLLRAFKSVAPVLALNDPFLPFNGRWRGCFAEKLVEHAKQTKKIILLVNLSFIPECWMKSEFISYIDVGKAADRARKKAEAKAKAEAELSSQVLAAAAEVPNQTKPVEEKKYEKGALDYVLPEHIVFAYREKVDWLFSPLANMSSGMRDLSGVGMPLALALLVVVMAAVMFPDIGHYHQKLHDMADNWDYEEYKKLQAANEKKRKAKFTKEIKREETKTDETIQETSEDSKLEEIGINDLEPIELDTDKTAHAVLVAKPKAKSSIEWLKLCDSKPVDACEVKRESCWASFRDYVRSLP